MARSAIAIGAWLTLVLSGCMSLDGLSQGDDGKGHASKQGPPAQTAQAGAGCDPSAPFTTIERMPSSDDAFAARWNSTRSTVVYNRGNDTHIDVFIGTSLLDGKADPFATTLPPPTQAAALPPAIFFPTISDDGLLVYYEAYYPAPPSDDPSLPFSPYVAIFSATRKSMDDKFGNGVPLVAASGGADFSPYLVSAARSLYWAHMDPATNKRSIVRMVLDKTEDASVVFESTASEIGTPVISADEKTLYYYSSRESTRDIFVATRTDITKKFENGVKVAELSTIGWEEAPTWLSADACELVFERRSLRSELWTARR
jgi:hypothetical protein